MFGTKKVLVWENVMDGISVTLTQGHGCGIDKKSTCLQKKWEQLNQSIQNLAAKSP